MYISMLKILGKHYIFKIHFYIHNKERYNRNITALKKHSMHCAALISALPCINEDHYWTFVMSYLEKCISLFSKGIILIDTISVFDCLLSAFVLHKLHIYIGCIVIVISNANLRAWNSKLYLASMELSSCSCIMHVYALLFAYLHTTSHVITYTHTCNIVYSTWEWINDEQERARWELWLLLNERR